MARHASTIRTNLKLDRDRLSILVFYGVLVSEELVEIIDFDVTVDRLIFIGHLDHLACSLVSVLALEDSLEHVRLVCQLDNIFLGLLVHVKIIKLDISPSHLLG